jgi:hypothetical protein
MPKINSKPKQLELFPRFRFKPGRLSFRSYSQEGVKTYKLLNKGFTFAEANVINLNGKPLLYDIYIKPGFELLKRNGIARKLLVRVIDDLKSKGETSLTLVVDKGQGAFGDLDPRKEMYLIRYYSRFGFKVIGKDRGFFVMKLDF